MRIEAAPNPPSAPGRGARTLQRLLLLVGLSLAAGCLDGERQLAPTPDAGVVVDADVDAGVSLDAGAPDAWSVDAGAFDSGAVDAGAARDAGGGPDAATGLPDLGVLPPGRSQHTATLLEDGRVLIAGGRTWLQRGPDTVPVPNDTLLLFDPETETYAESRHRLPAGRNAHTANLLADGRVLLCGGHGRGDYFRRTCHLYDPAGDQLVDGPTTAAGHAEHAAIRSGRGDVLIGGGRVNTNTGTRAWELYRAEAGDVRRLGVDADLAQLQLPAAAPTLGGRVLVAAGTRDLLPRAEAYLYRPDTNRFAATPPLATPRAEPLVSALAGGDVLVVGGSTVAASGLFTLHTSTERYDAEAGRFVSGPDMIEPHQSGVAIAVGDRAVLVAGGTNLAQRNPTPEFLSGAEVLLVDDGTSTAVAAFTGRIHFTATRLADGRILLVGGETGGRRRSSDVVEIFDPETLTVRAAAPLPGPLP